MPNSSKANKVISGFLIDPETQTIKQVSVSFDQNGSLLNSIYNLLQCSFVDVGRGCLCYLPSGCSDDVWFDDEGMFSDYEFGFQLPGCVPLVGRGLILGYDDEGDCISSTLTQSDVDTLKRSIIYHRRK
jgi:hypothetical protein